MREGLALRGQSGLLLRSLCLQAVEASVPHA